MDRPLRRRSPLNNPTERIQRLLTCMDDMEAYAMALEEFIGSNCGPEAMATLPPRPDTTEYQLESQRQQFTYGRTIAARSYMQRMRASGEGPAMVSQASQKLRAIAKHGLTEERKREILAEIDGDHHITAGVPKSEVYDAMTHQLPDTAQLIDSAAAKDAAIGLPPGVEIEPDPETASLDQDLKEGSLFK